MGNTKNPFASQKSLISLAIFWQEGREKREEKDGDLDP
jgi:hypothetical protein